MTDAEVLSRRAVVRPEILGQKQSPEAGYFRERWERFLPFAGFPSPRVFPPEIIGQGDGISIVTPDFAKRAQKGALMSETIWIARTGDNDGAFIYPLERAGEQGYRPMLGFCSPAEFEARFSVLPSQEEIDLMRLYCQVNAMITGGSDGLFASRLLMARLTAGLIGKEDLAIDPSFLETAFGLHLDLKEAAILERIADDVESGSIERMRELMEEEPVWFVVFAVDRLSQLIRQKQAAPEEIDLAEYQRLARLLTAANLGRPRDREVFLIPALNDATSYLKDLLMHQELPFVWAVSNRSIFRKAAVEARYNCPYLTQFFTEALIEAGFFDREDIAEGKAEIQASIKPVSSAAMSVAEDRRFQARVVKLAKKAGIAEDISYLEEDTRAQEVLRMFNKLVEVSLAGELPGRISNKIDRLVTHFEQRVFFLFDVIRCRVSVDSPQAFNRTVSAAQQVLQEEVGWLERLVRGRQAEAYLCCTLFRMNDDCQVVRVPKFPTDPAQFINRRVLKLEKGQLLYGRAHFHLPLQIGVAVRKGQRDSAGEPHVAFVEVQVGQRFMEAMNNATEVPFKLSGARSLSRAGLTLRDVEIMREEAQKGAQDLITEK